MQTSIHRITWVFWLMAVLLLTSVWGCPPVELTLENTTESSTETNQEKTTEPSSELIAESQESTSQEPTSQEPTSQEPTPQDSAAEPSVSETTQEASPADAAENTPEATAEPQPEPQIEQQPEATRRVLKVGIQQALKKPSDAAKIAQDNDIIEIAVGLYPGDVAIWRANNLTIRAKGSSRAHLFADGQSAERKAIWVIKGNNTTVEGIEFSGAKVADKNGAGIRQEGEGLTVRNCHFHDNENGILAGNSPQSTILIEYSIFERNGAGDGLSHNLYINGIKHLIFQHNLSRLAKVGHNLKSRAARTDILYSRLMDESTGDSSYIADFSNGGVVVMIGNVLQQGPKAQNRTMLSYAAEGFKHTTNEVFLVNNTAVNQRQAGGTFIRLANAPTQMVALNNLLQAFGTTGLPQAQTGWDFRNNIETTDAKLVSLTNYNYHLQTAAPARNSGVTPGSGAGMSLVPQYEYLDPAKRTNRMTQGTIDVGAYEAP
ncbi:MAG: right-handed parallel beta-helix repeat-containing protein [Myxococcales bacterium]|nr:right-handed parallel beta-helix repeat-containing protein [Myxococcales bacterium]